jgi:hypothetical protein
MSRIPALRSRTRHRGVNREKIFHASGPRDKFLREDHRSAIDFADAMEVVEAHAVRSLLRIKIAVLDIQVRNAADICHRYRPIDAVDGEDELPHLAAPAGR